MTDDPMKWLRDARKISDDVLSALGVKAVDHPNLGRAVVFPYTRAGETYAGKFRTIDKRFSSTKDTPRGPFNEDELKPDCRPGLPVVITEGELDCLSIIQAGWDRAVSVPDGWGQGAKLDSLIPHEDALRAAPFVVVAADNDEAGESMPRQIAAFLRGADVREARWPKGCKDANDVLVQHGEGALSQCLSVARRIDPPGGTITAISDLPPLSERRVLRIGLQPFDRAVALELGALSVWTGIPGSGKSTFLTWVCEKISVSEDIRVGLLPFETHPHTLRDQLALIRSGMVFRSMQEDMRGRFLEAVDRRFRIVHRSFDDTAHRIAWLEDMVHTLAIRDGCKLIVIDPWNELEHMPEPGESMTSYINWALQRIRQLAEAFEVHIALVAHPRKIADGYRAPTGYDVADSAAFFNKPSLGVTVHQREDEEGEQWVELNVWKVRNTRLYGFGKGKVTCQFDPDRQAYRKREALEKSHGE